MLLTDSKIFSIAIQEFDKHLPTFERQGLMSKGHSVQNDPLIGPSLWFSFVHGKSAMKLNIALTPATSNRNGRFDVYLVTPTNLTLDVENYLRVHGLVKEAILFIYTQQVPSFEKYIDTFLSTLEKLLETALRPIIEGKKWENIPFDWGDYK